MSQLLPLSQAFEAFSGMKPNDFGLSTGMWYEKHYEKGDFYNEQRQVCKYLGFIFRGVFRSFVIDEKSGDEKNVFLYSGNQFVVTFKSFVNQIPCEYYTQAMSEADILYIHIDDLQKLYRQSHAWEHFGRLLAQEAFNVVIERNEGLLFKSPEERYLDLIKNHPDIFNNIPLYHISSYLGIQGPSLSRIRKRISGR